MGTALTVNITGLQSTFPGWADENWDSADYYSLYIPENWSSWASLSWVNSSADLDLYLYDSSGNSIDSSAGLNNPEEVSANSSSIGNSTIFYRVLCYSGIAVDYNLTIGLVNLSSSPAFNQNDANSGGDAGDDFSSALTLPSVNGLSLIHISEPTRPY